MIVGGNMETQVRPYSSVNEQDAVRVFMQKVYIWMTGGLVLTGVIAHQVANSETIMSTLLHNQGLFFALIIGQLGLVMALSFTANRVSSAVAGAMFIAYSALNGLTLSVIFVAYTATSIAQVFFITAGTFAGMSVYGFVTKKDLTSMGSFLIMGLWGIIITMVVNIFLKSPAVGYAISFLGVFIFLGLTAYDTQKLKNLALSNPEASQTAENSAILGALILYLDFINLFLMLLRLFGKRK
jgi:hypothetical protein